MVIQQDSGAKEFEEKSKTGQLPGVSSFSDPDGQISVETGKRRHHGGGWITTPFIFGCEAAERLAMAGSHANLITFLVHQMHYKTLNAATTLNTFASTSMLSPLLGAFMADAYLGRYTTIALGSWIYLSGMLILTLTAVEKTLRPAPCTGEQMSADTCEAASSLQMGLIYLSFALMALGSGGIRPCVSPFGASQFDQTHHEEKKQLKHYFNWYYFSVTVAGLLATTVIVYIQDNVGWGLGFGLPTIVMLLSIVFFFGGTWLYRYSPPQGSPFTRMAQVVVAAVRKRNLSAPEDPSELYTGGGSTELQHRPRPTAKKRGHRSTKEAKEANDEHQDLERPSSDDDEEGVAYGGRTDAAKLNGSSAQLAEGGAASPAAVAGVGGRVSDGNVEKNEKLEVIKMAVGPQRRGGEGNANSLLVLRHSNQFRFLDKAAIKVEADIDYVVGKEGQILAEEVNPWKLCKVQEVEELKCIVRMAPMWATVIPIALVISQQFTYTVQLGRTMDRRFGSFVVPPASLHTISIITVLLWLPIYDKKVIPFLKRYTGNERGISFLQKIGVGFLLLLLTMVVTTLVEHKRRLAARHFGLVDKPHEMIPFSALWLVPQFVIGGLSESFMMVGHMEFFYYMLPEHMTSTGSALFMTALAIGSNLSSVVLHVVQKLTHKQGHPGWLDNNLNKAHLDYFYGLMTIVLTLDFLFYLLVARWYKKQRNLMQMMVESG